VSSARGRSALAALRAAEASGDPDTIAAAQRSVLAEVRNEAFAVAHLKERLQMLGGELRARAAEADPSRMEQVETAYLDLYTAVVGGLSVDRYTALRKRTQRLAHQIEALD